VERSFAVQHKENIPENASARKYGRLRIGGFAFFSSITEMK
jgi:hypothetical protein